MTTHQDDLCCGYCKQDIQLPALCAIVSCTECTPKHNIWHSKCCDKFETSQDKKFKEKKSSMRAKCGTPWHKNANNKRTCNECDGLSSSTTEYLKPPDTGQRSSTKTSKPTKTVRKGDDTPSPRMCCGARDDGSQCPRPIVNNTTCMCKRCNEQVKKLRRMATVVQERENKVVKQQQEQERERRQMTIAAKIAAHQAAQIAMMAAARAREVSTDAYTTVCSVLQVTENVQPVVEELGNESNPLFVSEVTTSLTPQASEQKQLRLLVDNTTGYGLTNGKEIIDFDGCSVQEMKNTIADRFHLQEHIQRLRLEYFEPEFKTWVNIFTLNELPQKIKIKILYANSSSQSRLTFI